MMCSYRHSPLLPCYAVPPFSKDIRAQTFMSWALAALDSGLPSLALNSRDAQWSSLTAAVVSSTGQQFVGLLLMGSSEVYTPRVMFLLYLPGERV